MKLEDTLDESVEFVFDAIGRAEEAFRRKVTAMRKCETGRIIVINASESKARINSESKEEGV